MTAVPKPRETLTSRTLARGLRELRRRDADLARVVDGYGAPPMWGREPGFAALVLIILEQQVSLASARAVFDRLAAMVTPLTAERLLALDDAMLKGAGLTRQKLGYCKYLAEAIVAGQLCLDSLGSMQDNEARATLMRIKGIGPWTADIYLLMALRRRDIWPEGDLALRAAMQAVKALPERPSLETFAAIGEAWRPWRAVAARILWHYYLQKGGRREGSEET